MILSEALKIAIDVREQLRPHCERVEIAGSIRRNKPEIGDIEIVAIPLPYETGLFENGVAAVVNQWTKVKGELEYKGRPKVKQCKYTQRILPSGMILDLFFATPTNWGYIYAIRTGSVEYSKILAQRWTQLGYHGDDGYLWRTGGGVVEVAEEEDLFKLLNIPFCPPGQRNI
jgi:DNA polymerase/3'-5' exonuclease PolX